MRSLLRALWLVLGGSVLLLVGTISITSPPSPPSPPPAFQTREALPQPSPAPDTPPRPSTLLPLPSPHRKDAPVPLPLNASPLRAFCFQTKSQRAWCSMLISAVANNFTIDHPAWGESYLHAKRIGWVLDAVAHLPDDQVVTVNDGTDILFNGSPDVMLRRFLREERDTGKSLIFNAERSCYAQQAFEAKCSKSCMWALRKARCISAYRETLWRNGTKGISKWRYLNAGALIGRVWAIRKFFTSVARLTFSDANHRVVRKGIWCDQSMITKVLVTLQHQAVVGLDHRNTIYLPAFHLRPEKSLCPPTSLHLCHSPPGEDPVVLHLNGKSRINLP
eukprot:Sspe_Gene.92864::Locus_65627_Transcript_1_1_Confidence_1.000_Length_1169::g.92864::m.92864